MAETLRAAAVQLQCTDDVAGNLERVAAQTRRAAELGARLILLPENFAFFGPESGRKKVAEDLNQGGPIQSSVSQLARDTQTFVIAGGFPERSADAARPFNTSLVFAPDGSALAKYRKVHLFDVDLPGVSLRESEGTLAGEDVVVVPIEGFNVGLSICYDLRFSELYRRASDAGADILTVPAAFTEHTGKDHWHVLLRARAIEWQCWVIAAAQWGQHPGGRRTYGHSLIADPWGTVIAECSNREAVCVADLDKALLLEIRRGLPRLHHTRLA
jgi:predicted amidohydrolase